MWMASQPISDHMCKALSCKKNSNPATVLRLVDQTLGCLLNRLSVCVVMSLVTVHVTNTISNIKHIVIEIQVLTQFSISQSQGSYTNHVDSHGGRGVSEMSTLLIKPTYLVKLSTKGEGGQISPKNGLHGLCMTPQYT